MPYKTIKTYCPICLTPTKRTRYCSVVCQQKANRNNSIASRLGPIHKRQHLSKHLQTMFDACNCEGEIL